MAEVTIHKQLQRIERNVAKLEGLADEVGAMERQLSEARQFIVWCQGWAEQTREAGSLRSRLRALSPGLQPQEPTK